LWYEETLEIEQRGDMSVDGLGRRAWTALITMALCMSMAAPVMAQDDDFTFDEDDATDTGDDDMTFDEDDVSSDDVTFDEDDMVSSDDIDDADKRLAVVALPTSVLEDGQRSELQEAAMQAMGIVKKYQIEGESSILPGLEDSDPETCVKEPLCLASVGSEAEIDLILVVRVSPDTSGVRLDVDFFDTREKLYLKYKSYENQRNFREAVKKVEPAVRDVFEIRDRVDGPKVDDPTDKGTIQKIFAYTGVGLGAVSLIGGAVFGVRANSALQEVQATSGDGSTTQTEARARFESEVRPLAATANVFYGVGLALGAAGAVLLFVDLGSDVADEDELTRRRIKDLRVAPIVSGQGMGLSAGFRF